MGRKEDIDSLGGLDDFGSDVNDMRSCDKVNHFVRSAYHQPNHGRCNNLSVILGPQLELPDQDTNARIIRNWLRSHIPIRISGKHKEKT